MKYITVQFIENHSPYSKDEIAGFPEVRAERLIARGIAIEINAAPSKEADRIKALRGAPETRHIPGPQQTKTAGTARKRATGTGASKRAPQTRS